MHIYTVWRSYITAFRNQQARSRTHGTRRPRRETYKKMSSKLYMAFAAQARSILLERKLRIPDAVTIIDSTQSWQDNVAVLIDLLAFSFWHSITEISLSISDPILLQTTDTSFIARLPILQLAL